MTCTIRGKWTFDVDNLKATHDWGIEIKFSKQSDQTVQGQLVGQLPARVDPSHLKDILITTQKVMNALVNLSDDADPEHEH